MNQPSWGGRFMRLPHGGDIACPQVRDYKESTRKPPCLGGWMAGFALPERGVLPEELANAIFCTIGDTTGRVLEGGVGKPQVLPGR